jgi:hypothetical protein
MNIRMLIEIRNEGNTPAIGIDVQPREHVPHMGFNVAKEQRIIADYEKAISANSPIFGDMLFPGSNNVLTKRWTIPVTLKEIGEFCGDDGTFSVTVILGIGYRSTIDQTARHCTVTVHDFSRTEPQHGAGFLFFKGQNVPLERLALRPSMYMAPIAE